MNRIFILSSLAAVTSLAGCFYTDPEGLGPSADGGGQGGSGGGMPGGSGTGDGQGGSGGTGGTGGARPPDGRPAAADAPRRDQASTPDRPASTTDGGASTATCGSMVCAQGQVCCNASCGICTAPGGVCTQMICTSVGACTVDSDCRLFDDYCTGCDCRALAKTDRNPTCPGPGVQCIRQPCGMKVAVCVAGKCASRDLMPPRQLRWFMNCGDPVCGMFREKPNVRRCNGEVAGVACSPEGDQCDVVDSCNHLLVCTDRDPAMRPGGCPIASP